MALSGQIINDYGETYINNPNGYLTQNPNFKLVTNWSCTQDILANTSTLTVSSRLQGSYTCNDSANNGGVYFNNSTDREVVIGIGSASTVKTFNTLPHISENVFGSFHTQYQLTMYRSFTYDYEVANFTTTINHNDDGTKTVPVTTKLPYFSILFNVGSSTPNVVFSTKTFSNNITLETIPRASQITSFPDFTIGSNFNITLNRKSDIYTNDLTFKVGNTIIKSITGVATSATVALSTAEQDIIYQAIPNTTTAIITLICQTKSGNNLIGSPVSVNASATVPSSIVPTFTTITHSEINTNVSTIVGVYAKSLSNIRFTITGSTGIKYSTIMGYKINYNNTDYNSNTIDTGIINWSGNNTITATITDSRGRIATKSITINVIDYFLPRVTNFTVTRCNSNGTANNMGTFIKIIRIGDVSSLNTKNNFTYKIYSNVKGSTDWGVAKVTESSAIGTITMNSSNVLSTYSVTSSYNIKMELIDKFNTTTVYFSLSTGQVVMSWGQTGVGVGKIWEQGALDVQGNMHISGDIFVNNVRAFGLTNSIATSVDLHTLAPGQYASEGITSTSQNYPYNAPWARFTITVTSNVNDDSYGYKIIEAIDSGGNVYIQSKQWDSWAQWRKQWSDGNDGAGSGLDADMLNGYHFSDFQRIGGRNLLTRASFGTNATVQPYYGKCKWGLNFATGYTNVLGASPLHLKRNTYYTLSFMCWSDYGNQWMNIDLFPDTLPQTGFTSTLSVTHHTWTFKSDNIDIENCTLRFFENMTYVTHIGDIKLEEGILASDWTPAPEDTTPQYGTTVPSTLYTGQVFYVHAQ